MTGREQAVAQERREECRRAVLRFLAERPAVAYHANTIRRRLNEGHEWDFAEAEVQAALLFRQDRGHLKEVVDPVGSTKYWQATADGVLAHERGQ